MKLSDYGHNGGINIISYHLHPERMSEASRYFLLDLSHFWGITQKICQGSQLKIFDSTRINKPEAGHVRIYIKGKPMIGYSELPYGSNSLRARIITSSIFLRYSETFREYSLRLRIG